MAGSLLLPGLLAAAGNLGAGESALGALSAVGEMILNGLVHNDFWFGSMPKMAVVQFDSPTSAPAMFNT
jgi:hypothetical protein